MSGSDYTPSGRPRGDTLLETDELPDGPPSVDDSPGAYARRPDGLDPREQDPPTSSMRPVSLGETAESPGSATTRSIPSRSTQKTVLDFGDPEPSRPPAPLQASGNGVYVGQRPVAGWLVAVDRRAYSPLFEQKNFVGRDQVDNQIVIDDERVSRRQCTIVCRDGRVTLQPHPDAQSDTFVDDMPIDLPVAITDGAILRMGETTLQLVLLPPVSGQETSS